MKLIQTYALNCGVPISKMEVPEDFFPLDHPIEKSVLIHAFAGAHENNRALFPAKIYEYFSDVVEMISPILSKNGYKIYQIGSANEPPLKGAEYLCGKTSISQCTFLVKNCALLIGNDSMWVHIRGAMDGALVALYGPTDEKNHGPYWRNEEKTIILESHRSNKKRPSYSSVENPKTINFIQPEKVANSALKLLSLESISIETYFIGQDYNVPQVELIPNVIVDPKINFTSPLVLRADLLFDEQIIINNLRLRKCALISKKEININALLNLKQNINSARIFIDNISIEWLKIYKKLGIKTQYVSEEKDQNKLSELRIKLMDVCLFDTIRSETFEDFLKSSENFRNKPLDQNVKIDTLLFKTNKFLLSDGKVYLSKAHWVQNQPTSSTDTNMGQVIDTPDFWADQSAFNIYSNTQK